MGIVKNILVLAVFAGFSAGSGAVPLIKPGCQQTGYNKSFQDLIHKVNIVGPTDDRDTLANVVKKEQLNLTPQQQLELSKAMGYLYCPGVDDGTGVKNRATATAFVAGQSDILITVAHTFYDNKGKPRFKSLSDCYFMSQDPANMDKIRRKEVPDRVYLPAQDSNFIFGTLNPDPLSPGDRSQDYVFIRLPRALDGVKPLPLLDTDETVKVDQPLLIVSASQNGAKVPVGVPVATPCQARDYVHDAYRHQQRAANFFADCDASAGASGSPALVEYERGKWAVAGIMTTAGKAQMDYTPYQRGKRLSGSIFVALDNSMVKRIRTLSRNGDLHIANQPSSTSIFIPTSAEN